MSLIQATLPTEKQKADYSGLRLLHAMKLECKVQFDLAWKKREGGAIVNKTVAEVQSFFDQYGFKAAQTFDAHGALQELIIMLDDSWAPLLPLYPYLKNQDGTVTIGD